MTVEAGFTPALIEPGLSRPHGRHGGMQRTPTDETPKPPAASPTGRPRKSYGWRRGFNEASPHEAHDGPTSAAVHVDPPRQMPGTQPAPEYPPATPDAEATEETWRCGLAVRPVMNRAGRTARPTCRRAPG